MTSPSRSSVVIAATVAIGTLLYVIASLLGPSYQSAFFAIPLFMGAAAAVLGPERPYRNAHISLGVALLIAVATFQEGIVCVVFALPVLLGMVQTGAWVGHVLSRHLRSRRARGGAAGLIVLLGAGAQLWQAATDDARLHPVHVAESSRSIAAPPEKIFELLTARELRVEQRWPWFIRIGLPMPEAMIVEQPGLHGRIRFEMAHLTAYAQITAWQPPHELRYQVDRYQPRDLPFHITRLGRDPHYGLKPEHASDWLTVLDTRYTIEPAPGGSVLRRRIVWRRHLAPDFYFGWLQQTVMERGQARLLALIEERVGASSAAGQPISLRNTEPTVSNTAPP